MKLKIIIVLFICINMKNFMLNASNSSLSILEVLKSPKSSSMGYAFTSLASGIDGMYDNPAAVVNLTAKEMFFMYNYHMEEIKISSIGFGFKSKKNRFGINLSSVDYGNFDRKKIDYISLDELDSGKFDASDIILILSWSRKIKNIDFGLNNKLYRQKIDDKSASTFMFDIGGKYKIEKKNNSINFGVVLQNVGKKIKFYEKKEKLPLTFKFGISYSNKTLDNALISIDYIKKRDNESKINCGFEYEILNNIFIRTGYNAMNDADEGFTFGLGINNDILSNKKLRIDYSFLSYGELGYCHNFSVKLGF
jgi:hypothetical protein